MSPRRKLGEVFEHSFYVIRDNEPSPHAAVCLYLSDLSVLVVPGSSLPRSPFCHVPSLGMVYVSSCIGIPAFPMLDPQGVSDPQNTQPEQSQARALLCICLGHGRTPLTDGKGGACKQLTLHVLACI